MIVERLFEEYPVIESEDIILKKIEASDTDDFFSIHSSEDVYRYIPGKAKKNAKTVENMIRHYERDFNKKKMIFLGIYLKKSKTKLVGIAEMFDIDSKVDSITIGYRLHPDYWGHGIATKSTNMMVDYLFKTIQVNRIQGFVMPENIKSAQVLKRNGFKLEGMLRESQFWKDKGVVDLQVFSLLKSDLTDTSL